MRLKTFLNEMTKQEALKIFGLTDSDLNDPEKLKKAYRTLSMQYHPDRGGSEEMMKKVNDANDILSKITSSETKRMSDKMDWEEMDRKYRERGAVVKEELLKMFDPKVFTDYFDSYSKGFTSKIIKTYPDPRERSPHYVGFEVEFFTPDRATIFTLHVSGELFDVVFGGGALAGNDISYRLSIVAYGFANNKKQKLASRDYTTTQDHSFLKDPKLLFPKAKLDKIFSGVSSQRKFKKRDMETYLKLKLKAEINNEYAWIPLIEIPEEKVAKYKLVIWRSVYDGGKFVVWSINGLYKNGRRISTLPTFSLEETESTAAFFEEIQKKVQTIKTESDLIKTISDMILKKKKELESKQQ